MNPDTALAASPRQTNMITFIMIVVALILAGLGLADYILNKK